MSARPVTLRGGLTDYLSLRRALGFELRAQGRLLGQFVDYLEARGRDTVTTKDALGWASLPVGTSPAWLAIRVSVVRGFGPLPTRASWACSRQPARASVRRSGSTTTTSTRRGAC